MIKLRTSIHHMRAVSMLPTVDLIRSSSCTTNVQVRRGFASVNRKNSFWEWTTSDRPSWKESYKEGAVFFIVMGLTGSLTMYTIRPCLKNVLGLEGSLWEGPNSYRIASILCISPMYALTLLTVGTLSGRHNYFAKMAIKILGRFFPKSVLHRILCNPARCKQSKT